MTTGERRRTAPGLVAAAVAWSVALASLLAGCGEASQRPGADGKVDATPRALAAVVVDHLQGDPRRVRGHWSDWNDPLQIEAEVDYGEDPEGGGAGETRTFRVTATDKKAYSAEELRRWFRCHADDAGGCEEEEVDGARMLYRWYPGAYEEEAGNFGWTVVRDDEVVTVLYEPSGYYKKDPRTLDLWFDPADLRAAALDPAMGLRTTTAAYDAGQALDGYGGEDHAPEKPDVVATTPKQLAADVVDYLGMKPRKVSRSTLDELGPDAVGAHLEFPGAKRYDPFTLDILTTVGRAEQISPLPCKVQRSRTAVRDKCFAWDADSAITWTLAEDGRPGVMWIYGAQDDDTFNRVESVAIRIESAGLTQDFFDSSSRRWTARFPYNLMGDVAPLTGDLSIGPETRLAD